jgi:hypothetical protein
LKDYFNKVKEAEKIKKKIRKYTAHGEDDSASVKVGD